MADDEMPIAPAITSASRVPQPSANPNASPPPRLRERYVAPAISELPPARCEIVEGELEAEMEQQQHEAERREQLDVARGGRRARCRECSGRR